VGIRAFRSLTLKLLWKGKGVSNFWTSWRVLRELETAGSGRSDEGKGIRPYKSVSVVVNFSIYRNHIDRRLDETTTPSRDL
jgi:hypothetical protein